MTAKRTQSESCVFEITQSGDRITCDYWVYPASRTERMVKAVLHRRVQITHPIALDRSQLVVVAHRMVTYIMGTQRGSKAVPRGLPWWEVGTTAQPVPPSGGEGGEMAGQTALFDQTADVTLDPDVLPSVSAPALPGKKSRVARSAQSVDLPSS